MPKISVLFLSQQRLLKEVFARIFKDSDFEYLPPVSDTSEARRSILAFDPDVVIVDLNPSLFGLRVADELLQACPTCRILALSSYFDPIGTAQLEFAGVQGVLSKDIGIDDLFWAVRETHEGRKVFWQGSAVDTITKISQPGTTRALTDREAQVLELIAQGLANKQVAAELGISIKTVEKHRQSVMTKLHAHETAGLSWRAFCMGVGHPADAFQVSTGS
jgi:DNA-binding NarL/FixJ family response regulator